MRTILQLVQCFSVLEFMPTSIFPLPVSTCTDHSCPLAEGHISTTCPPGTVGDKLLCWARFLERTEISVRNKSQEHVLRGNGERSRDNGAASGSREPRLSKGDPVGKQSHAQLLINHCSLLLPSMPVLLPSCLLRHLRTCIFFFSRFSCKLLL